MSYANLLESNNLKIYCDQMDCESNCDISGTLTVGTLDIANITTGSINCTSLTDTGSASVNSLTCTNNMSANNLTINNNISTNSILNNGSYTGGSIMSSGITASSVQIPAIASASYLAGDSSGNIIPTTAPGSVTITGTANEIIVSGGPSYVLSTPQPIATTSSPTFSTLHSTNLNNTSNINTSTIIASSNITCSNLNASGNITATNNLECTNGSIYMFSSSSNPLIISSATQTASPATLEIGALAASNSNFLIDEVTWSQKQNCSFASTCSLAIEGPIQVYNDQLICDQGLSVTNGITADTETITTSTINTANISNCNVTNNVDITSGNLNITNGNISQNSSATSNLGTINSFAINSSSGPNTLNGNTTMVNTNTTGSATISTTTWSCPPSNTLSYLSIGTGADGSGTIFAPFATGIIPMNSTYAINSSSSDFSQGSNAIVFNSGLTLNPSPTYLVTASVSFQTTTPTISLYIGTTGGSYDSLTICSLDCIAGTNYNCCLNGIETYNSGDNIQIWVGNSTPGGNFTLNSLSANYLQVS